MYFQSSPNGLINKLTKPKKNDIRKHVSKLPEKSQAAKGNGINEKRTKNRTTTRNQCYKPLCFAHIEQMKRNIQKKVKNNTVMMELKKQHQNKNSDS